MGIIWIPYGWAADDRIGMEHAIGRGILCYERFSSCLRRINLLRLVLWSCWPIFIALFA